MILSPGPPLPRQAEGVLYPFLPPPWLSCYLLSLLSCVPPPPLFSCSTFFLQNVGLKPKFEDDNCSERKLDHELDQATHPGLLHKAAKAEWHKRI